MSVLGRYPRPISDSPVFDWPYNALPGVDQDVFVRSNMGMTAVASDLAAVGTGVAIGVPIFLRKGDVVSSLTFISGGTAAGTPTHWAFGLYSPDDATLLATSADQLTAAWAANAPKKLAMTTAYTVTADGWYTAANFVTATTPPTLIGAAPLTGTATAFTGSKALGRSFGSGLTTALPASIATPTTIAKTPLVIVS